MESKDSVEEKAILHSKPLEINSRDADVTLKFLEQFDAETPEITPEQEKKLSRKVLVVILFIATFTELMLFSDKFSLSYASITDLFEDVGLDQNKFNNSSTLFYVGYLIGQLNLLLVQKFPIRYCMTVITFFWSVIILLTCAVTNYKGIYVTRFFLGFVESVAMATLNTTMGQFFTEAEKAASAPIFAIACLGCIIPIGFIAFGVMHAENTIPEWKLLFIIIGGISLLWCVVVFFYYPSNPADANFLSQDEKVWVIRRVQATTGASIEQKIIKRYQVIEALKDPVSWLFALFFLCQMLANNLAYQQNLLFTGMGGISNLNATLVSVASGGFSVICAIVTSIFMFYYKDWTAFAVIFWSLPSLAGSIAAATIAWNEKIAIIGMISLASSLYGIPWILMISWNTATCSGYTKKITRNGMIMIAYSIGNLISPQLWREKDAPRFIPAWIVQIVLSFFMTPIFTFIIWYILKKRNNERLEEINNQTDSDSEKGFVIGDDGQFTEVNLAVLDLTDMENRKFIYPL